MEEPLPLKTSFHNENGHWRARYFNSLRRTAQETSSTGYRMPICGSNGGVPLSFLSCGVDRHSTLMPKNVDDSLVNGRSGCHDSALEYITPLLLRCTSGQYWPSSEGRFYRASSRWVCLLLAFVTLDHSIYQMYLWVKVIEQSAVLCVSVIKPKVMNLKTHRMDDTFMSRNPLLLSCFPFCITSIWWIIPISMSLSYLRVLAMNTKKKSLNYYCFVGAMDRLIDRAVGLGGAWCSGAYFKNWTRGAADGVQNQLRPRTDFGAENGHVAETHTIPEQFPIHIPQRNGVIGPHNRDQVC